MPGWDAWFEAELDAVRRVNRWRTMVALDGSGPRFADAAGELTVSFASNDYLGLAAHPEVIEAAAEAARRYGTGATSSRLIVGDRPVHHHLEEALARRAGTDAALVFASGYQANLAVLSTLGRGALIVSDELNHASIIDGARLARTEVAVYRHGDVDHAAGIVAAASGRRVLVVTDSVFSMDGDVAPLSELSEMCARTGALLVADDAHAVFPVPPVDLTAHCIRVGTLSKTLGSQGGFVAADRRTIDFLVNRGRPFIFTTGLAPTSAAAALAALDVLSAPEGSERLKRLRFLIDRIRPAHPSPILAIVVGEEQAALDAAATLARAGLLVPAIRPPTVPPGSSRLRVSLSADHTAAEVDRLALALGSLVGRPS